MKNEEVIAKILNKHFIAEEGEIGEELIRCIAEDISVELTMNDVSFDGEAFYDSVLDKS